MRNAGHTDTLPQLRLPHKEERKVKAVAFSAGPSLKRIRVGKLESALGA